MAKAVEVVQLLHTTIEKEKKQFEGTIPRQSFIENTGKPTVSDLLKFFESKDEDQEWDAMYRAKDSTDQNVLADKAAAVSFLEAQHKEITKHYAEGEVSCIDRAKVGTASFLTIKDMIRDNVRDKG